MKRLIIYDNKSSYNLANIHNPILINGTFKSRAYAVLDDPSINIRLWIFNKL